MYNGLMDDIQKQINRLQAVMEIAGDLPELPLQPYRASFVTTSNGILVICPYKPDYIEKNRAALEQAGWKFTEAYTTDTGLPANRFVHNGVEMVVFYDPGAPGSTMCKRNLIGYEQRPVYEIACMDAESLV